MGVSGEKKNVVLKLKRVTWSYILLDKTQQFEQVSKIQTLSSRSEHVSPSTRMSQVSTSNQEIEIKRCWGQMHSGPE